MPVRLSRPSNKTASSTLGNEIKCTPTLVAGAEPPGMNHVSPSTSKGIQLPGEVSRQPPMDHGVWIMSNNGLFLLKPGDNTFIQYHNRIPRNEFSFKHPIIWSSFREGLFVYNPQTGKTFHPDPNMTQNVETYFIDRNGSIWFGSLHKKSQEGTGLNKIITTGKFFRHYLTPTLTKEKVAVFGLYKDKNRDIWVGTNNYNYLIRIHPDGTFEKGNFLTNQLAQLGGQPRTFLEDNHEMERNTREMECISREM